MQAIRDLPNHFQNGWNRGEDAVSDILRHVVEIAAAKFDEWKHSDYVQQTIKPWFERNIRPLDQTDYLLLITGTALSALLLSFALTKYGVAALPLGLCAAGMMIGGCIILSSKRVQQHFDDNAWEHIDLMRRAANNLTSKNQDFAAYNKERAALDKPEFHHLKDDLKRLDEEMRKVRLDIAAPHYANMRDIVKAHLDILAPKVQGNAQDKKLWEDLEHALDNVGTDDQDLAELEKQKQKLKNLQTPQALADQPEISRQIDEVVKAAQGTDFDKTKEAFLEYLKGMQQRLSSQKDVEDLP